MLAFTRTYEELADEEILAFGGKDKKTVMVYPSLLVIIALF